MHDDKKTIKILVVDDEHKVVDVLRAYLEKSNYKVYEAYNGKMALELFASVAPHLVILDLMLPDIPGEDVLRVIRRKSRTPIIMLSAKAEEEDMLTGLNIGADDYIVKPSSPRQITARVAAVLRRAQIEKEQKETAEFCNGYLLIDYNNYIVKVNGNPVDLTPTEFKILSSLSKSPNKAFTRDQLIVYALEGNFQGYDRTIDTYIKNLRKKIEPDPKKPTFVLTVHSVGYRFGGT